MQAGMIIRNAVIGVMISAPITLAILMTSHWEIAPVALGGFFKLNRWTGAVTFCGTAACIPIE
jgi:hypothetical protein